VQWVLGSERRAEMIDWRSAMTEAEHRREQFARTRRNDLLAGDLEADEAEESIDEERPPVLGVLVAAFVCLLAAGIF
jgi:hypothetical protein